MLADQEQIDNLKKVAKIVEGHIQTYSGRGMFGRSCYGIDVGQAQLIECIEEAAIHGIREASYDSLGKGMIVYWRNLELNPQISIYDNGDEDNFCGDCGADVTNGICPNCGEMEHI